MYDKIFGDFKLHSKVPEEIIKKYENVLPEELLSVWRECGFGTILNGYIKIINPDEYKNLIDMSYFRADVSVPIFVTGFGDIIVLEEGRYIMLLKFREGDFEVIPGGFKFFWGDLENEDIEQIYSELSLYKKAVKHLGQLEFGECFGYTPLLGLGGKKKIKNLERVNAKVHIELIVQLLGRIE